jgi:hypothetical protein
MKERVYQVLLIVSFTLVSWLGFMVVHEFGHILFARLTGGSVSYVNLHPLRISWSAFAPNPHPQFTAWGGPVLGASIPLILFAIARFARAPGLYLFQFFAGFCLVANGLYIFIDAFVRDGDSATLLHNGAVLCELLVFAALAAPIGFWLWNGLGQHFGLRTARGRVSHSAAVVSVILFSVVIATALMFYKAGD